MSSAVGRAFKTAGPHLIKALASGTKAGVKEGVKAGTKSLVKEHGTAVVRNARSALARMGARPAMISPAPVMTPITSLGLGLGLGATPYIGLAEPFPRYCSCNYTAVEAHPKTHPMDPRDGLQLTHRIMKCDSCASYGTGPKQYLGKLRAEMTRRVQPSRKVKVKQDGGRKTRRKLTRRTHR